MNAVERLLAHAEQVVSLFDEMLGPFRDSGDFSAEHVFASFIAPYASGRPFAPNEVTDCPPRLRGTLTDERLSLMERWSSSDAAEAAVFRVVEEGRQTKKRGRDSRPQHDTAQVIQIYCGFLAERERLLDQSTLRQMLGDVVAESSLWGLLARDVVNCSQSVVSAMERLLHREPVSGRNSSGRFVGFFHGGSVRQRGEWAVEKRGRILPAINALRIYCRPLASAATEPSEEQPGKNCRRGGRPSVQPALAKTLAVEWRKWAREYDGEGRATHWQFIEQRNRGKRKKPDALAALNALHLRLLRNRLRAENRIKQATQASRTNRK